MKVVKASAWLSAHGAAGGREEGGRVRESEGRKGHLIGGGGCVKFGAQNAEKKG
jgi:hypothetical protein